MAIFLLTLGIFGLFFVLMSVRLIFIKNGEFRVALTPAGVSGLVRAGHEVIVEPGLGLGAGFSDEDLCPRTEKLTVFLVEQNAFHALKLAHRGYVMVNGIITMSGTGKELLERPEVKSAYLEGGRQEVEATP